MNDIQPTMDDSQVMDFISRGAVVLEGSRLRRVQSSMRNFAGRQHQRIRLYTRISGRSPIAPGSRWRCPLSARTEFLYADNRAPSSV